MTNAEPQPPLPGLACPLCGGPNGCAPAACGSFEVDCWCRNVKFSADLLARVPSNRRGAACICERCALAAAQANAGSA